MAGAAAQQPWLSQNGPPQQGPSPPTAELVEDEYNHELFKQDDFRLWCMKVIPCTKRFVHDWTICPFAHAGEKAVRRDPRLHNYTGIACPDMKKTGSCIRGEKCPYAHNVFEYWLHPTRYRTQLCNDGPTCRRGICFFAHSLEELRVPACKPYVSPEALARASLEAIQQNPHPLGQQLPNPVAAAQQQAAAIAAMGRPHNGMRGGGGGGYGHGHSHSHSHSHGRPGDSAPSSLTVSATPFVPHSFHSPSGEPVRYSAPCGSLMGGSPHHIGELHSVHSMGNMHMPSMHSGEYGGGSMPNHFMGQQQLSAPAPQQQQRWSGGGGGNSQGGMHGQGNGMQHRSQYGASMPSNNGSAHGMRGQGQYGSRGGSAPHDSGMPQAGANLRAHQQYQQQGVGSYNSGPGRVPSPPNRNGGNGNSNGGHKPYPSGFAAMQQHPSAFGSYGGGMERRNSDNVHSVRSTYSGQGSDEDEGSPANVQLGSGRASPEHDLAQSLASLKIALTQQQLAAAAGSNHEVVISTLHQILKDAMAQQGGPGNGGSLGGSFGAPGGANEAAAMAAAATCAAAAAAAQQHQQQRMSGDGRRSSGMLQYCNSPNAAVRSSFGSDPSLNGSAPRYSLGSQDNGSVGPEASSGQLSASPDAIACYQAAMLAAAGGYTGNMLPLRGSSGALHAVPTPRTSCESAPAGSMSADVEPAAPAPAGSPGPVVEAAGGGDGI